MSELSKKILIILGLTCAALAGMVWFLLNEKKPIVNFPPSNTTIVALGDSLTVGVGASSPEKNFVRILEERLHVRIENKGISGNTTADALARTESDVTSLHPGIVIVLLGGNDYLRKMPQTETFANLEQIIRKIQADGSVVLLLGVRGGLLHDKFDEDFEELAKRTGSTFVPNVLDDIIGNTALMSDQIHPNDAGYLKIADKIAPILQGLVLSAPKNPQ